MYWKPCIVGASSVQVKVPLTDSLLTLCRNMFSITPAFYGEVGSVYVLFPSHLYGLTELPSWLGHGSCFNREERLYNLSIPATLCRKAACFGLCPNELTL